MRANYEKIFCLTALILVLSGYTHFVLPNGEKQIGSERWEVINDRMHNKVGIAEQDLISQWDVPDGSYTLSSNSRIVSYNIYNSRKDSYCEAKFLIEMGKVTKWGHSGNKACELVSAQSAKLIPNTL